MTGWLVGIGVPVARFLALIGSVWHHKGRNTGRHVAPTGTLSRDVHDATVPVRATEHGPPWEVAHEPDGPWIAELRAALDEVQPSGWVLGAILATQWKDEPGQPAHYGVQFDEQGREVGWLPDPYDMWGTDPPEPYRHEPPPKDHPNDVDSPNEWINAVLPMVLADTADHGSAALALEVADYMAAQDADAARYGGDLADWCAYQLRQLRETLCP